MNSSHPTTSRRSFFRHACCTTLGVAGSTALLPAFGADAPKTSMTPDEALARMKKGNEDFLTDKPANRITLDSARRLSIARGQAPFAVLVGCSDSRVPPEVLFGAGLGELFIVRNAGNSVDTTAMGSIQYGVAVLGAPLVVVLGHERCGAVEAALSVVTKSTAYPGSIGQMIESILPAAIVASRRAASTPDEMLDAAVRENVRRVVERLRNAEPMLADPQRAGKLKVVGARYDLDDGKVDFFLV